MQTVTVTSTLPVSTKTLWKRVIDISRLQERVPFSQKAWSTNPLGPGGVWYDQSRILWIPWSYKHVITKWDEGHLIVCQLPLILGAAMQQEYQLDPVGKDATRVTLCFTFTLGGEVRDKLFAPILKKRLEYMLTHGVQAYARE